MTSPALGFACAWQQDRRETWSGTPSRLLAALERGGPVADLGYRPPAPVATALKLAGARRVEGRVTSTWRHGRAFRRLTEARVSAAARAAAVDAALTIQDLGVLPVPYLVLQDLSYDVLLDHYGAGGVPHFRGLSRRAILRLRDRQRRVYDGAAALLPMSHWLGEELVRCGADPDRVFPVHPGANTPVAADVPVPPRRQGDERRLLFVGRDPHTKGLDVVLAALAVLRRDAGPHVRLTVAGPAAWPYEGGVPDGVDHLGAVGREVVDELMGSHDLFVMPSRLEGFGIAFVEALSRGLPCVGRDAFAMPEVIRAGVGGVLVSGDDAGELAAAVAGALGDDELYRRCAAAAPEVRAHYTWDRAAAEIREIVTKVAR